jgi:hypothetical protein
MLAGKDWKDFQSCLVYWKRSNKKWHEQHTKVVNKLSSQIGLLARLVYHLPRKAFLSVQFNPLLSCLPLWGSMRLKEDEPGSLWPKSVQVEINNALRVALGYKMEYRISIKRFP